MVKATLKHFFLVCIFLLSGNAQILANSNKTTDFNFPAKNNIPSYSTTFNLQFGKALLINQKEVDTKTSEYESELSFFENEEDDETGASKKHLKFGNYSTGVLFTNTSAYTFSSVHSNLISDLRFLRSTSPRFLLLQVFRL